MEATGKKKFLFYVADYSASFKALKQERPTFFEFNSWTGVDPSPSLRTVHGQNIYGQNIYRTQYLCVRNIDNVSLNEQQTKQIYFLYQPLKSGLEDDNR